ncbi:MAG: hypothetical protein ACFHWX_18430 [Bacteroidota bacterium]
MKILNFYILLLIATSYQLQGQDISTNIKNAKSAYADKQFSTAREELQNALFEIDNIISDEILKLLPAKLGSFSAGGTEDSKEGSATSMGLFITRIYGVKSDNYAEVMIADNSPMVGMVNSFLSNPMLAGLASQAAGQKTIRIDGYKGMLQKEEGEDGKYSIMVPFGDSMLTMETNVQDESEVINMGNQIPLSQIVALVQ